MTGHDDYIIIRPNEEQIILGRKIGVKALDAVNPPSQTRCESKLVGERERVLTSQNYWG